MKKNKVNLVGNLFSLEESEWQSLHSKGFGEKVDSVFCLNVYEVLFLLEKRKIEVFSSSGKKMYEFSEILKKFKIDFNVFLVFSDLIKKGYNVKSGFRYGVEFRVYKKGVSVGEEHSIWLVKVLAHNNKILTSDYASFNRVAHSTKKKVLFAVCDVESCVTYFESAWTRM